LVARRLEVFFGTLAPAARASDKPIAIACLRLVTFRPERPLRSLPALRSFIARSTLAEASFEYFRAMLVLLRFQEDKFLPFTKVPGVAFQSAARRR
jgi:hypothetical protein